MDNYHELDGTVEFYGRINAILKKNHHVLDIGAGRGSWYYMDKSFYRRNIRDIKSKVKHLIGADVDKVVLENPTTHKNIIISNNKIPLDDNTIDVIIADWVLEHVENPQEFCLEINNI